MTTIGYESLLSEADYLKVEEAASNKNEYVAGRMFAMTGATAAHNILTMNLYSHLAPLVRQSGCNVFALDFKLRVSSLRSFYYPDLLVTCEKVEPSAVYVEAPILVVEVLSPSTMSVDRREKLQAYRAIPSLAEYVLVHQDQPLVEIYRKDGEDDWALSEFKAGEPVCLSLPSQTLCLAVDDIYLGIDLALRM